jgi:hypothetical protein
MVAIQVVSPDDAKADAAPLFEKVIARAAESLGHGSRVKPLVPPTQHPAGVAHADVGSPSCV